LNGFTPTQLDRDHKYGKVTDNQLRSLEHIGLFQGDLPPRGDKKRGLVDPYNTRAPLEARVKSYLEVNCSTCHVPEGGGNAKMNLKFAQSVKGMNIVGVAPAHTKFEIPDALLVYPGSPEKSVLYQRISRRGTSQMPPVSTTEVDQKAVEMIGLWIRGLGKGAR
jgi:mono/diheme cytochrome c family protein